MRFPFFSGLLVSALMLSSVTPALAQDATPAAGYPADTLAIVDAVKADVTSGLLPGAVLYIESPRGILHEGFGVSDVASGTPIDKDAPFQIGSNTKMMTSTIILQLQEEGLLKIDDPMSTYLPDVAAKLPLGDTITLHMLLQHTSGIYDYIEDLAATGFATYHQTGSDSALAQVWTPQEIVDYVITYRAGNAYFPPGTNGEWHYSNTNYVLLGLIIETVTGKSFAENLQDRILTPLGMTNTTLAEGAWSGTTTAYYAAPYTLVTSNWNLSQAWAAGAVVSTPQDMALFLRALLGGKLFKNADTLTLMQTTIAADLEYGLGLIRSGGVAWGHGGQTLGFRSIAVHNPETDTVVIGWTNTAMTDSIAWQLLEMGAYTL